MGLEPEGNARSSELESADQLSLPWLSAARGERALVQCGIVDEAETCLRLS